MKRLDNWTVRVHEYLEMKHGTPFKWGESDCCLFACNIVMVMTGVDIAKKWRGKYKTARGAKRFLKRGLNTVTEETMEEFNCAEVKIPFRRRFDLALIESGQGLALGVINAHGNVWAQGENKMEEMPSSCILRVWRI